MTQTQTPILTTKLYIPQPSEGVVSRQRLLERLHTGLEQGHKLMLVLCPCWFWEDDACQRMAQTN